MADFEMRKPPAVIRVKTDQKLISKVVPKKTF